MTNTIEHPLAYQVRLKRLALAKIGTH